MTTEREMLEYAAKACNIDLTFEQDGITTCHWQNETESLGPWNPLANSADCAAMCAKLMIDTLWTDDCVVCGDDSRTYESEVPLDDDQEAAWRYAACKVAEAIGKGMK